MWIELGFGFRFRFMGNNRSKYILGIILRYNIIMKVYVNNRLTLDAFLIKVSHKTYSVIS